MNVDTRRADRHTHAELSKSEEKRMKEFFRTAMSYDGKYGWTVDTLSICVHLVLLFNDLSFQGWQGRNQELYCYLYLVCFFFKVT